MAQEDNSRFMRIGEFELSEPVPEMKNTIAIGMFRPWVDVCLLYTSDAADE